MIVSLREVLSIAEKRQIAIGSFNTPSLESVCAVIEAAEELALPVIIQMAQCHEPLIPLDTIGPIMIEHARKAHVPVCVHLDHGGTFDYLTAALNMGFTSIMFDGSELSYEENVQATKQAVEMAAAFGADVEAELGCMGQREFGDGISQNDGSKIYTDPIRAKQFVEETKINALACSFGTTHGIYLKKPKLDFDIVRQVCAQTKGIPVVMHGGSGVGKEDFHEAIRAGVRKINYFTYMDKAGGTACETCLQNLQPSEPRFYSTLRLAALKAMKENVKQAMKTFALMD